MTYETPSDSDGLHDLVDRLTPEQRVEAKHLLHRVLEQAEVPDKSRTELDPPAAPQQDDAARWSWVGSFSGPADLGENHDKYLDQSGFGEPR